MSLATKTCVPCRGGLPALSTEAAQQYLEKMPQWELSDHDTKIERSFQFPDFAQAMAFSQQVGQLAEEEGHHPDIEFGWGYCRVTFYTHKINGLHENDFIMAAKVNLLASP